MSPHFIIDFETLSQDTQKGVVLCSAYFNFDWDRFTSQNPYTFSELVSGIQFRKLCVRDQCERLGYVVDKETLAWWKTNQGWEAIVLPSPSDVTVEKFLEHMLEYCHHNVRCWWSRSNTFDPAFLARLCADTGFSNQMDTKLRHWRVRDTRTYIDAALDFPKINAFVPFSDQAEWERVFVPHNPVHDVAADVLRLQKIVRAQSDMETPDG